MAAFRTRSCPSAREPLRSRLRPTTPLYDTNIVCVNAADAPGPRRDDGPGAVQGPAHDRLLVVGGRPASRRSWRWASHLVDEIWVGSEHVRAAIEPSVSKPVHVFPVPDRPADDRAVSSRLEFGLPEDRFAFIFSFNFWSVFERKNPLGLIEAFSRAFAPDEGPILVAEDDRRGAIPRRSCAICTQPQRAAGRLRPRAGAPVGALPRARRRLRRLRLAPPGRGLRADDRGGDGAREAGRRNRILGQSRVHDGDEQLPRAVEPRRRSPTGSSRTPRARVWADPELDAAAAILRARRREPREARSKAERRSRTSRARHSFDAAAEFVRRRLAEPCRAREIPSRARRARRVRADVGARSRIGPTVGAPAPAGAATVPAAVRRSPTAGERARSRGFTRGHKTSPRGIECWT